MTMLPKPQRAAGMRAAAPYHPVGIAGHQAHAVVRHAQPFGDKLREAGLVALALRAGADDHLDHAFGFDGHLGALTRHAGRGIHIVGDADAAMLAARRGLGAAGGETVPVAQRQSASP